MTLWRWGPISARGFCNVAALPAEPGGYCRNIQQGFLKLRLDEDRNLTSFFWYRVTQDDGGNYNTTDEVICCRFTRLPFGLTCSPFLLSASLRELASMHRENFPMSAALVDSCTFIDNFAAGADDSNVAVTIYYKTNRTYAKN